MHVAVLGLGEAGQIYAHGLVARGVVVTAYDPDPAAAEAAAARTPDLRLAEGDAEAARGADVVLSLVTAHCAREALEAALPALAGRETGRDGVAAVYADLNTASPDLKAELASSAADAGVLFADVAVLAPTARAGLLTPLLLSGTGAKPLAHLLTPLGVPVSQAGPEAGASARLKLLRSVFMKGLAGLVLEGLTAAGRAGPEAVAWLHDQMARELTADDGAAFVDHLAASTRAHAARRAHEMDDAAAYLGTLGVPAWMTDGTRAWLHAVADGEVDCPRP
ncbi:NAD(P)-dependent oxidoreductase [Georgenia alba]|uniref:DUF1932 domain-containing protein n=1 Tax=Georgenia alba TaxID=2233858 RepID=A0ABW2Q7F1_9MICO